MKPKVCAGLAKMVQYWIPALRLDDWKIHFREASTGELEAGNCGATVDVTAEYKHAVISLPTLSVFDVALEYSLVHELLHIVFIQMSLWSSERDPIDQILVEQGLNTVARLLVDQRRAMKSAP